MPTAAVRVYSDRPEAFPGLDVVFTHHSKSHPFLSKIEACIESPFRKTVYLDRDSRLLRPVWELFDLLDFCDISMGFSEGREALSRDRWYPVETGLPLSSSTIAFRPHALKDLLVEWKDEYLEGARFPNRGDQMYLARLATTSDSHRLLVLPSEYRLNSGQPQFVGGTVKIITGTAIKRSRSNDLQQIDVALNQKSQRRAILFMGSPTGTLRKFKLSVSNVGRRLTVFQFIHVGRRTNKSKSFWKNRLWKGLRVTTVKLRKRSQRPGAT